MTVPASQKVKRPKPSAKTPKGFKPFEAPKPAQLGLFDSHAAHPPVYPGAPALATGEGIKNEKGAYHYEDDALRGHHRVRGRRVEEAKVETPESAGEVEDSPLEVQARDGQIKTRATVEQLRAKLETLRAEKKKGAPKTDAKPTETSLDLFGQAAGGDDTSSDTANDDDTAAATADGLALAGADPAGAGAIERIATATDSAVGADELLPGAGDARDGRTVADGEGMLESGDGELSGAGEGQLLADRSGGDGVRGVSDLEEERPLSDLTDEQLRSQRAELLQEGADLEGKDDRTEIETARLHSIQEQLSLISHELDWKRVQNGADVGALVEPPAPSSAIGQIAPQNSSTDLSTDLDEKTTARNFIKNGVKEDQGVLGAAKTGDPVALLHAIKISVSEQLVGYIGQLRPAKSYNARAEALDYWRDADNRDVLAQDIVAEISDGNSQGDGAGVPLDVAAMAVAPDPSQLTTDVERGDAATIARTLSADTGADDLKRANARDYRLSDEQNIGEGNLAQKLEDNFDAIELIKELETDNREPTDEEKAVLARFVGWGAFGQAFQDEKFRLAHVYEEQYGYDASHTALKRAKSEWIAADHKHYEVYKRLKKELSPEEFKSAAEGILNQHFTSPVIVKSMWEAVRRLGFTGGRVLEPAAGVGTFLGFQPEDLLARSTRTGVEIEPLTGRILSSLYPSAQSHITGFENAPLPDNAYDLAISNVPFGAYGVNDKTFNQTRREHLTKSIHNYFFAKGLDKVKPGGVIAFVTSKYTLDSAGAQKLREHLADGADLLGAVRLPNNSFEGSAGTKVTTDIVFLRKHDPSEEGFDEAHPRDADGKRVFGEGEDWVKSAPLAMAHGAAGRPVKSVKSKFHSSHDAVYPDEAQANVNGYFHANPHMVLGQHGMGSGYGLMSDTDHGVKWHGDEAGKNADGQTFEEALAGAMAQLPVGVMKPRESAQQEESIATQEHYLNLNGKAGAFVVETDAEGKERVLRRVPAQFGESGSVHDVSEDNPLLARRIAGLCALRDKAREINALQRQDGVSDDELAPRRAELHNLYDSFAATYGNLHHKDNVSAFASDPDAGLVLALENKTGQMTPRGRKTPVDIYGKADIFNTRTITPLARVTSASSPEDALAHALNEHGYLHWGRMAELLGQDADDARDGLAAKGLIYRDPTAMDHPITSGWVSSEEYLSGNVREKLAAAKALAMQEDHHKFPSLPANIAALEAVQPVDLLPSEIDAPLGASWIPSSDINEFARHLFGRGDGNNHVSYDEGSHTWGVSEASFDYSQRNGQANTHEWGYGKMTGTRLLQLALSGKSPKIYYPKEEDQKTAKVNPQATAAAQQKMEAIQAEFSAWIWNDPARASRCAQIYNEKFNDTVLRSYNGQHLSLAGMAPEWAGDGDKPGRFFDHSKDAVWRTLQGNTLLDHCVGSGKTSTSIASAIEMRRLGLAKKPLVLVPNQNIVQWEKDFREQYPGARVLTVWEKDWTPANRRELTAKMATGDWDAILMTHSAFEKIPPTKAMLNEHYGEMLENATATLASLGFDDPDERPKGNSSEAQTAKQIQRAYKDVKKKLADKLEALEKGKDDCLNWEELGVDAMLVDEWDACFPYDTPIITDHGVLLIGQICEERLQVNVLSWNKAERQIEWKPVVDWLPKPLSAPLVRITHQFGKLVCTANHQIWTVEDSADGGQYVDAGSLTCEHTLRLDGSRGSMAYDCPMVTGVERLSDEESQRLLGAEIEVATVYDLSVADNHNYYASNVLVSNSFKNLWHPTQLSGVSGVQGKGSTRASDFYMKSQHMLSKNGGRNLVLATATPISNTMVEMYSLLKTMNRPDLKRRGMDTFDAWAANFGLKQTRLEKSAAGDYRKKTRFVKWNNFPELMKLYRHFADVKTIDDLPVVKARLPEVDHAMDIDPISGKEKRRDTVSCPMNEAQVAYMAVLQERAKAIRGEDGREVPDPKDDMMLKLFTDARKAALDPRMLDDEQKALLHGESGRSGNARLDLDPGDNGKVGQCASNLLGLYQKTNALPEGMASWPDGTAESPTPYNGTQLVFLDMGVPKSIDATGAEIVEPPKPQGYDEGTAGEGAVAKYEAAYNQYRDGLEAVDAADENLANGVYGALKQRLVASGVPAEHVRYASEFNTDAKRKERDAKMNSGEIRILIGSTAKMGAGLNVQTRLAAVHHLDCPWRPRDIEQRNGRIERQGNLHKQAGIPVRMFQYVTEGSFDALMWSQCAAKAKMINAAKKGAIASREYSEDDGGFGMVGAIASGDPREMERVETEERLASLEMVRKGHEDQQMSLNQKIAGIPGAVAQSQKSSKLAAIKAENQDHFAQMWEMGKPVKGPKDPWKMTLISPKGKETEVSDKAEALTPLIERYQREGRHWNDGHQETVARYGGFEIRLLPPRRGVDASVGQLRAGVFAPTPEGHMVQAGEISDVISVTSMAQKLDNVMRGFGDEAQKQRANSEHFASEAQRQQSEEGALRAQLGKPFSHEAEYKGLQIKYARMMKELASEETKAAQNSSVSEDDDDAIEKSLRALSRKGTREGTREGTRLTARDASLAFLALCPQPPRLGVRN